MYNLLAVSETTLIQVMMMVCSNLFFWIVIVLLTHVIHDIDLQHVRLINRSSRDFIPLMLALIEGIGF